VTQVIVPVNTSPALHLGRLLLAGSMGHILKEIPLGIFNLLILLIHLAVEDPFKSASDLWWKKDMSTLLDRLRRNTQGIVFNPSRTLTEVCLCVYVCVERTSYIHGCVVCRLEHMQRENPRHKQKGHNVRAPAELKRARVSVRAIYIYAHT